VIFLFQVIIVAVFVGVIVIRFNYDIQVVNYHWHYHCFFNRRFNCPCFVSIVIIVIVWIKVLASVNNHEEACNMLNGKGRVRTLDLGYHRSAMTTALHALLFG
jgi:hypothetical protein